MSIRLASLPVGATFAPSGGTATNLVLLSSDAANATAFIGTAGVTPLTRTEISFSAKTPKVSPNAPGGFTQGRSSAIIRKPKVLANLKRTINTGKVEFSIDPETTQAEFDSIKSDLVNLIVDADLAQLWINQSLD